MRRSLRAAELDIDSAPFRSSLFLGLPRKRMASFDKYSIKSRIGGLIRAWCLIGIATPSPNRSAKRFRIPARADECIALPRFLMNADYYHLVISQRSSDIVNVRLCLRCDNVAACLQPFTDDRPGNRSGDEVQSIP